MPQCVLGEGTDETDHTYGKANILHTYVNVAT